MKVNKWTLGLAAAGLVSLPSGVQAEEKMNQVWTALSSTTISGYVDTSAQWNLGTGNVNAPGYVYGGPSKADGFNLNVVKLSLERPLDESQWAAGYKVDLWLGPDATTYGTSVDAAGNADSFAIKQAYVALRAPIGNGLDFKVGVFDTIIGYETADGPYNPNFTRSYGNSIEPVAHTGVLATYQFSEMLSASFGIANTFGPIIGGTPAGGGRANPPRAESYKTYMGSLAFTAPENWGFLAGSTLYGGVINGFNAATSGITGGANQTSWYVGGTLATPVEGLRLGASYDYVDIHGGSSFPAGFGPGPTGSSGYRNATALYASFQATEKLSLHGRAEYFSQSGYLSGAGLPSKVFAYTATLQYDLWQNVLSRLEFRWDHQADGFGHAYGGVDVTDPVGGDKRNSYILLANIAYKF